LSKSTNLDPAALPAQAEDGPPFQAPWQARAFAVAVTMCQAGCYTWDEFRSRLMAEIAQHPGESTEYYQHWLNALEKLLADKGFVAGNELEAKTREFANPR
jgi:nitrile hydratase accessory protein